MAFFQDIWRGLTAPVPAVSGSAAHEGATSGRRLVKDRVSNEEVNSLHTADGETLRGRARQRVRNNVWASNAVASFTANAIGTGIKPQSLHPDPERKRQLQEWFKAWTDTSDPIGQTDWYGQQAIACRAMVQDGESIARTIGGAPGQRVPLQVQLLEADHLPLDKNEILQGGKMIIGGVEVDQFGRREAFHLYGQHPGSWLHLSNLATKRIPAAEIQHLYHPTRPGQLRGLTWLSPILVKLYELDQYDDAEVVRKKTAAMFGGFIVELDAENSPMPSASSIDGVEAPAGIDFTELEPGTWQKLRMGEDVRFSEPADLGGQYETFMVSQLHWIASAFGGLPYHLLTGDLKSVNYSSIRAGLLEFHRRVEQFQFQTFVYQFCRPHWKAFIEACVWAGLIPAAEYQRDPAAFLAVEWRTPKWAWVDPEKDIAAEVLAMRAGLKARSAAINELGYDEEEVDAAIARDNERADGLGLVFDSDPRKRTKNGQVPTEKGSGSESESSQSSPEPELDQEERQ